MIENKHLDNIIKASDNDSLAIFVGAGVSKSSESTLLKLPSWYDLISEMKNDLGIHDEIDYLKIAQLYYLEFGEYVYYKKIKSFFPDNLPPSKIHKKIFEISPHIIITTNWDNLLEETILENAFIYSTIGSDRDLMKSGLDKKLIKMHGDFKNHNIVFKEDDYLTYEINFPLISNYIKSILSTHTILFIGYSYNDFNIKQIINWTKFHSNVRPPMYLALPSSDAAQIKYLHNHGISTIIFKDTPLKLFDNDISNKLYSFLNEIKSRSSFDNSEMNIINNIHNKLCNLNSLNSILADQVTESLSNCELVYINDGQPKAFLKFYDNEITLDYDEEIRKSYQNFKKILHDNESNDKYKKKLAEIFRILKKANISGIIYDNEKNLASLVSEQISSAVHFQDEMDINFFVANDFDYTKKTKSPTNNQYDRTDPYILFQQEKFELAYVASDNLIVSDLKHKNYPDLLITLFNQNVIIQNLKFSFLHGDKYENLERNNILEIYDNFPKNIKKSVSTILELVNLRYFYKFNYIIDSILTKNRTRIETKPIFYWDNEEYKADFLHCNIINFIIKNGCLLDEYKEFRYAISKFIELKIIKQYKNNHLELTKVELYSCIKYLKNKELVKLMKNKNKFYSLKLDDNLVSWLSLTAFSELVEFNIQSKSSKNEELRNVLLLLSLCNQSKEVSENTNKFLLKLFESNPTVISHFEMIFDYITLSWNNNRENLNDDIINSLTNIAFDEIILKSLANKSLINIYNNRIRNLFIIRQSMGINVEYDEKVQKVIEYVNVAEDDIKVLVIQTYLYSIFLSGSDVVKNRIKECIGNIDLRNIKSENLLELKLFLLAIDMLEEETGLHTELSKAIKKYEKSRFSTHAYTLKNILLHLVEKKNRSDFSSQLNEISTIIDKYENGLN